MALGLNAGRALLNDVNPHLINFYRWIACGLHPSIPMRNDEAMFYRHRNRFNELVRAGGSGSTRLSVDYLVPGVGAVLVEGGEISRLVGPWPLEV